MVAYRRKGETYADLACGFGIAVYRYLREALDLLAARAPTLAEAFGSPAARHSSSWSAPCCGSTRSA